MPASISLTMTRFSKNTNKKRENKPNTKLKLVIVYLFEGYLDANAEKCSNRGQGTLYVPGHPVKFPRHLILIMQPKLLIRAIEIRFQFGHQKPLSLLYFYRWTQRPSEVKWLTWRYYKVTISNFL